jgi:hypothetical protein
MENAIIVAEPKMLVKNKKVRTQDIKKAVKKIIGARSKGRKASLTKWQSRNLKDFVGRPGDALQHDLLSSLKARGYHYMLTTDQADFVITQLIQDQPHKEFCIIADDWDFIAFPKTDNYKLLSPKRSKPWTLDKMDCKQTLHKMGHINLFEIYCASGSDCIQSAVKSVSWKAAAKIFKEYPALDLQGFGKDQKLEIQNCHEEILELRKRIGNVHILLLETTIFLSIYLFHLSSHSPDSIILIYWSHRYTFFS